MSPRDRLHEDICDALVGCGAPRGSEEFEIALDAIDRYAQHCAEKARSEMADYCVSKLNQRIFENLICGTPTLAAEGKAVAP